jgi:hypothetical protein
LYGDLLRDSTSNTGRNTFVDTAIVHGDIQQLDNRIGATITSPAGLVLAIGSRHLRHSKFGHDDRHRPTPVRAGVARQRLVEAVRKLDHVKSMLDQQQPVVREQVHSILARHYAMHRLSARKKEERTI